VPKAIFDVLVNGINRTVFFVKKKIYIRNINQFTLYAAKHKYWALFTYQITLLLFRFKKGF